MVLPKNEIIPKNIYGLYQKELTRFISNRTHLKNDFLLCVCVCLWMFNDFIRISFLRSFG